MLKIGMPDFKRGDADEVVQLNSVTNFNYVLRACGLEAVAYLDEVGSSERRRTRRWTWALLFNVWFPKTPRSSRRCALSLASEVDKVAR